MQSRQKWQNAIVIGAGYISQYLADI